ncbi:MAG TPA: hypothetical protein VH092_11440, partial [Urbifossiella sp.]|nr:hypothetical protein [Urbifossiella sp.]
DRPRRPRPRDDDPDAPPPGEDEGGDRPRGRGGRPGGPKKKGPPLALLLVGGGFLLLTCCGGGAFGVYYVISAAKEAVTQASKKLNDDMKKGGGGGGGAAPAGWVEVRKDGWARAYFPGNPKDEGFTLKTPAIQSTKSLQYADPDGSLICTLAIIKFTPTSKQADRERDLKLAAGMINLLSKGGDEPRTVDWLGGKATETEAAVELLSATAVTRSVIVGNTGFVGMVTHKNKPEAVASFFGSVENLTK